MYEKEKKGGEEKERRRKKNRKRTNEKKGKKKNKKRIKEGGNPVLTHLGQCLYFRELSTRFVNSTRLLSLPLLKHIAIYRACTRYRSPDKGRRRILPP